MNQVRVDKDPVAPMPGLQVPAAALVLAEPPGAAMALLDELARGVAAGWWRQLDWEWVAFLSRAAQVPDTWPLLAAGLASHQLARGHACLDLEALLAQPEATLGLPPETPRAVADGLPPPLPPAQLLARLAGPLRSAAVAANRLSACTALVETVSAAASPQAAAGHPGDSGDSGEPADPWGLRPLVRVGHRLYLRRAWRQEQALRAAIAARLAPLPLDDRALRQVLDALFPARDGAGTDWQRVACALALRHRFAIVTGGPGTGKTTTVVKLLVALQHLALQPAAHTLPRQPLRIRLAAPTGKAAARLGESIRRALGQLPWSALDGGEDLHQAVPTEVSTVHRLLGSRPDSRHFRHHAGQPLPLDVLVIDEASMLDLEMAAAVVDALPEGARLVLLGDKDQLASVEAGAVLGDLCARAEAAHYRADTEAWLQSVTGEWLAPEFLDRAGHPLDQAITQLRQSHRFQGDSGIGRLAEAVNQGQVLRIREVLHGGRHPDLALWPLHQAADWGRHLGVEALAAGPASSGLPEAYAPLLRAVQQGRPAEGAQAADYDGWARQVLRAQGHFQLLTALRAGPFGVEALNARLVELFRAQGGLGPPVGDWCLGRPVMVTRNDPALGLMNGDVGVTLLAPPDAGDPRAPARLRVAFPSIDRPSGVHWVLPSRLPAVETAFAMTVHKAQGSEWDAVALVLPDQPSAVLTRELVYTGITRARQRFSLLLPPGAEAVLEDAVQRRVQRAGGLAEALRRT